MREKVKRDSRGRLKKKGSSKALLWWLVGGFGALLVVGVALVFLLGKGRVNLGLELPNEKVTPDNYYAVKHGFTLTEVEAILGKGRPPSSGDFDAICGGEDQRYVNPFFKERSTWEENHRRGLMFIWNNGRTRLLITFSQAPDRGGRVLVKVLLQPDGSVLSEAGNSTTLPPATSSAPNQPPNAPQAANPAWDRLVGTWEVEGDPRIRIRFGADRKMGDIFMVEGRQVREKVYTVREVQVENGRIAPQLELGSMNGNAIAQAGLGEFWFENGTLRRDPGNGKPTQTLRRVN